MTKRKMQNKIREKMAETFVNSKDIILDTSILRITGNMEVIIENYKGLIEFTDKKISVKANPTSVTVIGEGLELCNISDDILCVTGKISDILLGNREVSL